MWGKSGVVYMTPFIAANLAALLVRGARSGDARKVLDDVDALVAATDEAAALAECQRVRGLIARDEGDLSGAVHWLETAIATSQAQAARLYELRATTALAEILAMQGRKVEGYRRLSDLYGWFTEGHRGPDLRAAQAVLEIVS